MTSKRMAAMTNDEAVELVEMWCSRAQQVNREVRALREAFEAAAKAAGFRVDVGMGGYAHASFHAQYAAKGWSVRGRPMGWSEPAPTLAQAVESIRGEVDAGYEEARLSLKRLRGAVEALAEP